MKHHKWGLRSRMRLRPAHPDLRRYLDLLLRLSPVDLTVLEVARKIERQKRLVEDGASQTMNSRHLPDSAGIVHAADVAPIVDGKVCWAWPVYYDVAEAAREVAKVEEIPVRWGGIWDRGLAELTASIDDEVSDYVARRRAIGKKAFLDGPHHELPRELYPGTERSQKLGSPLLVSAA